MPDKFEMTDGVPIENLHAPMPNDDRLANEGQKQPEPERARHKRLRAASRLMDHPCNKCQRRQQAFSSHHVRDALNLPYPEHTKPDLCYCCTAAALLDLYTRSHGRTWRLSGMVLSIVSCD